MLDLGHPRPASCICESDFPASLQEAKCRRRGSIVYRGILDADAADVDAHISVDDSYFPILLLELSDRMQGPVKRASG